MPLATNFEAKVRVLKDLYNKMSSDEIEILLKMVIKDNLKLYFDVIQSEQRRLERETGLEGVSEYVEFANGEQISDFEPKFAGDAEKMDIEKAGKVSKETENAVYCDEKGVSSLKSDTLDGFLGYCDEKYNDGKEF